MIHYHGGPITPDTCAIRAWTGRHACISFAAAQQLPLAAQFCQSFMIDNGAFTFWRTGNEVRWDDYYVWLEQWINHPGLDFAIVPDVIDGTEGENDALIDACPISLYKLSVVWHINESIQRLKRLADCFPRVCIGSSGEYDVTKPDAYLKRMHEAISAVLDKNGYPITRLHGLRCLNPELFRYLPLSSADSTMVARNIGIDQAWKGTYQPKSKETRTQILVERIEHYNGASRLTERLDTSEQLTFWS